MQERRLQVFVSSTYTDLREERQAAVEAILAAGHIPAGMELFTAGDQSQMEVIRQWIADSDVFLLILGGRYGSIDPASGKSFIHLEYEHGIGISKPLFACVINEDALEERIRKYGSEAMERSNPEKLATFRQQVLSRIVRFWSDAKDIKLAIHESLGSISRRSDLRGWIRGDHAINTAPLAEELARLAKENAELRKRLSEFPSSAGNVGGLAYEEVKNLLSQSLIEAHFNAGAPMLKKLKSVATAEFGQRRVSMLHVLWNLRNDLAFGFWTQDELLRSLLGELAFRGLIKREEYGLVLSQEGRQFLDRLELEVMHRKGSGRKSKDDA